MLFAIGKCYSILCSVECLGISAQIVSVFKCMCGVSHVWIIIIVLSTCSYNSIVIVSNWAIVITN